MRPPIQPRNMEFGRCCRERHAVWRRVGGSERRRPSEIEAVFSKGRLDRILHLRTDAAATARGTCVRSHSHDYYQEIEQTDNGQSSCEVRGPRELRSRPISGHLYPGASTQRFDRAVAKSFASGQCAWVAGNFEGVYKAGVQRRNIS